MTSRKSQTPTFEDSLKRLEDIVDSLEQGSVSLDKAVELYEEGIKLSRECAEKLRAAELKIKKLTKDINGQFELTDLRNDERS